MSELISFDDFCAEVCEEPLSPAWQTFYAAVDGRELTSEESLLFERCAGRPYVARSHRTAVAICGRNSQKTWSSLKRSVYRAVFADSFITIRRGERPAVIFFAQDLRVGGEAMAYAKSLFQRPLLRAEVIDERASELFLRNGVIIRILPASVRSPRGWRIFDANLDEASMYETDTGSSNQDVLILQSVGPAMSLFGDVAETRIISTPWRREGAVWEYFQRRSEHLDAIVWQADTVTMNPSFPVEEINRARREFGPEYVAREFLAEFTNDINGAFPSSDIDACIVQSRASLPQQPGMKYVIAIDSAGGDADSFTCAVAHRDGHACVFDAVRGWSVRRSGLDLVLNEIRSLMQLYSVVEVVGDQFSYDALAQLFRDRKMGTLKRLDGSGWTAENKQKYFIDFRLGLAQGQVELLDHAESLRQLRAIEALKTSGGHVRFAARRGHDDYPSAMVLAHHLTAHSQSCSQFGGGGFIAYRGGGSAHLC